MKILRRLMVLLFKYMIMIKGVFMFDNDKLYYVNYTEIKFL